MQRGTAGPPSNTHRKSQRRILRIPSSFTITEYSNDSLQNHHHGFFINHPGRRAHSHKSTIQARSLSPAQTRARPPWSVSRTDDHRTKIGTSTVAHHLAWTRIFRRSFRAAVIGYRGYGRQDPSENVSTC